MAKGRVVATFVNVDIVTEQRGWSRPAFARHN